MHELVTLVEGKGARRLAGCVTLKVLVWNCASFQRKYIDHTVDPGRTDHIRSLVLGVKRSRELVHIRAQRQQKKVRRKSLGRIVGGLELGR